MVVDSGLEVVDVRTKRSLNPKLIRHVVSVNNRTEALTRETDAVITLGNGKTGDFLDSRWAYPDAATPGRPRSPSPMNFLNRYADFETFRQQRLETLAPAGMESRILSMKSRRPDANRVVLSGVVSKDEAVLAAQIFGAEVVSPREDDSDALRAAFLAVRDAVEPSTPFLDFVSCRKPHFSTLSRKLSDDCYPLDTVARYRAFENDVLLLDDLDSRRFLGADSYYDAKAATGEDPAALLSHISQTDPLAPSSHVE